MWEVELCREQSPRMYCEAGPVKIRLDGRVVPDLDPGPLAREHRQQPPAGSVRHSQNLMSS
jgi:hypothetical protein